MPLEWNGAHVARRVRAAAADAVNDTVDAAAQDARLSHTWLNRRGQLQSEIAVEHASSRSLSGRFGTTRRRGFYGLFHEIGTVTEFARPFLRPAADRHFPTLAARLAHRLRSRT